MTNSRTIPQAEWRTFFDGLSKAMTAKQVQIEAASLELGDQVVAEWLPLLGVTYDSHDDLFDVALGGLELDHLIRRPRQVLVQEGPSGVEMIAVVTEDGTKQLLRLRDPLILPAPGKQPAGSSAR
jgi:Family of unknown function (DUF5335)